MTYGDKSGIISSKEYLAFERQSELRHEYLNGRIVEKIGGSLAHNTITVNLIFVIGTHLRKRSGNVYASAMRIQVPSTNCFMYPDVLATTDESEVKEEDILLNPAVILEVLSDSTASYDRGVKFQHYRTIESLQEYLMVSQDSYRIEHYVRQPDGQWLFSEATSVSETIHLPIIECDLPLATVYKGVKIDVATPTNGQPT